MNNQDLQSLLIYARTRNIMDKPFQYVYNNWIKDISEWFEEDAADSWLATQEAHDMYELAI